MAFCLRLSVIREQKVTTILLFRRPIRAPDQISDRFYVISMVFLSLSRRRPPWPNVLSGEEQEDTAVFAGYFSENSGFFFSLMLSSTFKRFHII